MRKILCLPILLGGCLWAQTPADPMKVPPETVIGIVDGVKVTAAELQHVVTSSAPALQETLKKNPMELLRYYGFIQRLAGLAEAAKLDQQSPQRERLRLIRMQILAEGQLTAGYSQLDVMPDEQRKYYDDNRSRFASAKVKVIYLPFMANPPKPVDPKGAKIMSEAEALAKAEKLVRELRAGADFVALVKQHSEHAESVAKDGDFGTIRGVDNYPEEIKKAVLGAKAGAIVGPLRLPNGFYIFRVDESDTQTYEQVKSDLYTELKDQRWRAWMDKVRSSVEIKLP
ncbi:MAG: peptidylprolyl isomerase [Bryobacterales bacterium]|nr:peptidylprolyl isomerase [Bryobacterales bacterium]